MLEPYDANILSATKRDIIFSVIFWTLILSFFFAPGCTKDAEFPPRDKTPNAYETRPNVKFIDTICAKCHKP